MNKEQQIKDFMTELLRVYNIYNSDAFLTFDWDCILGTAMFNLSLDIQYDMDWLETYYYQNAQNIIFTIKNTQLV